MAISVPAKRRWWTRAAAEAGAATDATRVDAAAVGRAVVAAGCFGAAAIHFAFAPDHFGESRVHGAFFFLAGWAQLGLGLAVLLRPSRAVLRAVVLVNAGLVLVWAMSRLTGLPFGDDAWIAEAVGVPDVVATVLEVVAVAGAYALLTGGLAARTMSRALAVGAGVVLGAVLVGLTTASVAPALAGSHSHGAAGHSHAASGHTDGASGGSGDHPHAAVAGGIETASGTSPCEQSGAVPEDDGTGAGGHGHHGPTPQQAITDPATRAALADQLAAARAAALAYPTAADATAAGYRKVTTYLPCIAAHYMKYSYVDGTFDPSAPEMLLYDGDGPDARIVGLSYYVLSGSTAPEGFAGPNDPWHQHIGLCIRGGLVVGGSQLSAEECAARGGRKGDGSAAWMVHAWVVPGWESAWGTFSAEHPELGASVPH
jgi:hypothetical protein